MCRCSLISLYIAIIALSVFADPLSDPVFLDKLEKVQQFRQAKFDYHPSGIIRETDADSAHSWDAAHYHIAMELFPPSHTVSASVIITGVSEEALLDTCDLHFAQGMIITDVECAGINVGYTWAGDNLRVQLDRNYAPGDTFVIEIDYFGIPPVVTDPNALGGMTMFWGSVIFTYTDPEGARSWYPCYDKPFDKAAYSAEYITPQSHILASNGHLDSTVVLPNNRHATYWTHNYPIETYLISIAASNYAQFSDVYNDIPLEYYVYPGHLTAAQNDFQDLPDMLECFEISYGEYPFEKYGMAEAPIFGGGGAMEHQTMTTLGSGCINGAGSYQFLYAHELAHMWFGDALSIVDWPHIWLSEGFATYSEPIYAYYRYGHDYFLAYVRALQDYYFSWETPTNRHAIYDPPPGYLFSPIEYQKAACVLHMIRYYLGDFDFFDMMQDYFATYEYGLVSTDDFQAKCEEYYGDDLDWFFQQWIYSEGYPIYEYTAGIDSVGSGIYEVNIAISQTQEPELPVFQTMMDAAVYSGGIMTHTEQILIGEQFSNIVFNYVGPMPDSVVLDPDDWILGYKINQGLITEPSFSYVEAAWHSEFLAQGLTDSLVVTLFNNGLGVSEVRGSLTSDDPTVLIPYNEVSFGYAGFMTQFSNQYEPVPVTLTTGAISHWAEFHLALEWTNGDTLLTFMYPVGNPTLLLVDDDGGSAADSLTRKILDSLMVVYRYWDIENTGLPSDLDAYEGMIWCSGHAMNPLTMEEVGLLSAYLDAEGKLLLTGTNIASDLAGNAFLADYLGLQYVQSTAAAMISGVAGDPIGGGLSLFLITTLNDMDVFTPVNGGITCFNYVGVNPAGIHKEAGYKVVTLGFDLGEAWWDHPSFAPPDEVMYAILHWLEFTLEVETNVWPVPSAYNLLQVYPNPFNSELEIAYNLSHDSFVKITIYNTLGQQVTSLYEGQQTTGVHRLRWNGSGFSSGVYLISMESEGAQTELKKAILLK